VFAAQLLALFFGRFVTVTEAGKDAIEKWGRKIVTVFQVALIWEILQGVFTRKRLFVL
jgi:hypothetical protein